MAIVSGASRGIGRATAIRLARDFEKVVVVARTKETLEETAGAITQGGGVPLSMPIDLRESYAAEEVVQTTLASFSKIDVVVNVAGAVPQKDLFDLNDHDWVDGLSLKFHAARRLSLSAWKPLRLSHGSVVFMSGTSAVTPKAGFAAVGSINAAIVALVKAFADRGIKDGVQVNSILPGPVMTDRRRAMLGKFADSKGLPYDNAVLRFAEEAQITRYGTPEDVAEVIAFLVSPPARWMNGVSLRIDGGEVKAI